MSTFWEAIDRQLSDLKSAKTVDDVLRICPPTYSAPKLSLTVGESKPAPVHGERGFFAGSGGDGYLSSSLCDAGWKFVWAEAEYHWCMCSPDGECLTYVEGDLYRGNSKEKKS